MRISRSALGVLALATVVAAQQQPTFHTEANYVRVDVYATDSAAQPILDLKQDDFEILEDGKAQQPVQFEHITLHGQTTEDSRRDPNNARDMRSQMESSRARLFVLFLDDSHVELSGSHNIRAPLTKMLDQLLGPNDLFGVMTPEISASNVSFARKTTTIDGILSNYWHWGERDRITSFDPTEQKYNECYPGYGPVPNGCQDDDRGVAAEMILRRRETRTLDALEDLVRHLRGLREERKAVIVISDGWQLFRPNSNLARRLYCEIPGQPLVYGPGGKLYATPPKQAPTLSSHDCDPDRLTLAQIDNDRRFKDIPNEANRANVSFYPVDPRGLPVWDAQLGPRDFQPPPVVDQANLKNRIDTLQTLGEATDGLAIVNSNDLDRGMKRIVDDLTSYYLLGYYSTGKLDGKFHGIKVRIKRPGVNVRARRGYQAASQAEINAAKSAAAEGRDKLGPYESGGAGASEAAARKDAVEAVIAPLESSSRELPLRVSVAAGWTPASNAVIWTVGEVPSGDAWRGGGDAEITLMKGAGATLVTAHATIAPGARTFRAPLTSPGEIIAGDYGVRVRVKPASDAPSQSETIRFALPALPASIGAILIRRGLSTGNREVPTADPRFRRSEQLRIEVPAAAISSASARLLDRTGKELAIPVAAAVRNDPDGSRWMTAQLALAPLAAGDYAIELAEGVGRVLVAFRVVP